MHWHRRCITAEEVVGQQENELRGLLESGRNFEEAVTQRMFAVREAQLTIENALNAKNKGAFKLSFNKWMAITFIAIGLMIVFYIMRDQLGNLGEWLNNPSFVGLAFGTVIVVCLLLYYLAVPKKTGGSK
jgi:hypothetical protein